MQMPMPMPVPDEFTPMMPAPLPPPNRPVSTLQAEAHMAQMINDMDPFMKGGRRRSAFPTASGGGSGMQNASQSVRRSGTSAPKDASGQHIVYGYRLAKCLGRGTFSKVYLGIHRYTEEQVALKFIKNRPSSKSDKHDVRVQREISLLTLIHHPNIIRIKKRADTQNNTILVMEYAPGGELLSYIRQNGRLKETEARQLFRQIISAIDFCHKNGILHRDLKLENVMLDADKTVKIIDFGFANIFHHDRTLNTYCGSPFYAAPEMVNGVPYVGPEVDIWSMGVILFFMLCGRTPFEGENLRQIYQKISQGHYTIPPNTKISNSAADLIRRMLQTNQRNRIRMSEICCHPWVNEGHKDMPADYFKHRPNHVHLKPNRNIVYELTRRHNFTEREVLDALRQYQPGQHPAVSLYYLYEDYFARRRQSQQQQLAGNAKAPNSSAAPPPATPAMDVPPSPALPGGLTAADHAFRRSLQPASTNPKPAIKHDRRSAYTIAEEHAQFQQHPTQRIRKLSNPNARPESSPFPPTPAGFPMAATPSYPPGQEYFDRPKHLSQNMADSPTGQSFLSSMWGFSRNRVNSKSGHFDQHSLNNLSANIMDKSAPNLEKRIRKSAIFNMVAKARKSMPFLRRPNMSPPVSPGGPMTKSPLLTPGTPVDPKNPELRRSMQPPPLVSTPGPSIPLSPSYPGSPVIPHHTAFPPGIPATAPVSPRPPMHLVHPMPQPKHIITPAGTNGDPHLMTGPHLTAALAAADALAPSAQTSPTLRATPSTIPVPAGAFIPAPQPPAVSTLAPRVLPDRRAGNALLNPYRSTTADFDSIRMRFDELCQKYRMVTQDLGYHLLRCAVNDGKYQGQRFEFEVSSPARGLHTVSIRHQKGNWITFRKMAHRFFKEMGLE
ncbi:hypothetical protein H4R35_002382 [Dimargaris xerosporica]|nr:hypothetical protein H4R35_002382 [Dimargaris xerosporica]